MFVEHIKRIIKPLYLRVDVNNLPPPATSPGLHSTPPGQYPEKGPKPSKLGVCFYYLSIVFCVIGIIMLCRYPMLHDEDKIQVTAVGFGLILAGMFSLVITNFIVNRENRAFVEYLDLKVEQYMAQHKKNIQAIPPDGPLEDI